MSIIKKSNTTGFTLLEVMIALVIFSIGLLGLAGLQSAGVRQNQKSYSRTIATQLVYDMADRIRNNPVANYETTVPSAVPNCSAAICNSDQLASFDRQEWNTAINNPTINVAINNSATPLLNAAGFITRLTSPAPASIVFYRVSIGWDEENTGAIPAQCLPTPTPGIACVNIEVFP